MHWERLTPDEIAGLDAAMTNGIAAALLKASGLLIIRTGATGDGGWICAYPPPGLSFVAAREWARRHGLCFAHDDLYLTHEEVSRAGADMAVIAHAREIAGYVDGDDDPTTALRASIKQDAPLPSPFFRAQASVWQATISPQSRSSGRPAEGRSTRAWMRAFQAGFHRASRPLETGDEEAFILLLEVADLRRTKDAMDAENP